MQILSPVEAAALLHVNVVTLHRWRRAGTGPRAIQFGPHLIRYRLADIEAWLATSTATAAA